MILIYLLSFIPEWFTAQATCDSILVSISYILGVKGIAIKLQTDTVSLYSGVAPSSLVITAMYKALAIRDQLVRV